MNMPTVSTIEDLSYYFGPARKEHMEVWTYSADGQSLCALLSGDVGWLMYLRENGDTGFSTRNPNYRGPNDTIIEYRLENGQTDTYPAAWALPVTELQKAVAYFITNAKPAPWLVWHNDSGDGVVINQQAGLSRE